MISIATEAARVFQKEGRSREEFIKFLNTISFQYSEEFLDLVYPIQNNLDDVLDTEDYEIQTNLKEIDFEDYNFNWVTDVEKTFPLKDSRIIQETINKQKVGTKAIDLNINYTKLILSKCHNPNQLTHDSNQNKQGLVYGMVQSGKTLNMLFLSSLALHFGYNFIIILSGINESLRKQTQDRFNDFFQLNHQTNPHLKIISLTNEFDYSQSQEKKSSGIETFKYLRDEYRHIVVIKKQQHNLKKLSMDLKALYGNYKSLEYDIKKFNALIIDDEADNASQNTSKSDLSKINELITEIRKTIHANSYVGYTATPQACFGAEYGALVGYPKDFIIPISPVKDKITRENETYLGLEEFYLRKSSPLLNRIVPNDTWPFWTKNNLGKTLGIYNPNTGTIIKDRLINSEREHIQTLLNEVKSKKIELSLPFIESITCHLVSTALLWKRHSILKGIDLPSNQNTLNELIRARNLYKKEVTLNGIEQFPYSAYMINLAYMTEMHGEIKELYTEIGNYLYDRICTSNISTDHLIIDAYKKQSYKSREFGLNIPDLSEISSLIIAAYQIAFMTRIYGVSDRIYELNSNNEVSILDYESADPDSKPKTCSILIGGHLLSRGLTIQNLLTTFFIRSQHTTLGDTNLQMCRWFGHRKKYIDIISVFCQQHTLNLFTEIALCDQQLRKQLEVHLIINTHPKCVIVDLLNSPLFKLTSPNKSRFFTNIKGNSFSGLTKYYRVLRHEGNYRENFDKTIRFFKSVSINDLELAHNRAILVRNIAHKEALLYLSSLSLAPEEYSGFNLESIKKYIEDCQKNGISYKFNFACHGLLLKNESIQLQEPLSERRQTSNYYINSLMGGTAQHTTYFAGDIHIDEANHDIFKNEILRKRHDQSNILVNIYILNPNYLYSTKTEGKKYILPDNENYESTPGIAFAISFPTGGVRFNLTHNAASKVIHDEECPEIL
jgi:hypothetical protein